MDGKSVFGDLKSKLGFGHKESHDEYYEEYDEYAEADDYGEYGYDESYAPVGSEYDPYDSVTTREVGGSSRGRSTMPRLVSIDDVRARTQPPTYSSESSSSRRNNSSSSFRTMVDSSLPPQMTPEGTAAASAAASAAHHARSEGLNSLFEPTTSAPEQEARASRSSSLSSSFAATATNSISSGASSRFTPTRTVKIVAPISYNDVEEVSQALKLGNAVVLNLKGTPDALGKRVLDFSFGVASALDASVECIAAQVFAITRFSELSEGERAYLHTQGLI